jgi:hypothetical protein
MSDAFALEKVGLPEFPQKVPASRVHSLIKDSSGDMVNIRSHGVAHQQEHTDRHDEHNAQSPWVAEDVDELLVHNGEESGSHSLSPFDAVVVSE